MPSHNGLNIEKHMFPIRAKDQERVSDRILTRFHFKFKSLLYVKKILNNFDQMPNAEIAYSRLLQANFFF